MARNNNIAALVFFVISSILINLSSQYIANTQEFQVQLVDNDWDSTANREATMNEFVQIALNNLNLEISDFTETVSLRRETSIDFDNCDTSTSSGFIRYRQWIAMDNMGQSSIDLKIGTSGMTRDEALDAPAAPSNEYESFAQEDCEEDIHYCEGSDFARSTKLFFTTEAEVPTLENCGDLRDLFPDYFDDGSDSEDIEYSFSSRTTYYVEYNTQYDDGSLLRMQFNLEYPTSSDASAGTNFQGGEFSFTLWSPDEGRDYPQDPEIESNVRSAYHEIIQTYGSPGSDDCGSTYFSTRITSANSSGGNSASTLSASAAIVLFVVISALYYL